MAADAELNDLSWPTPPPLDGPFNPTFTGHLLASEGNMVYVTPPPPPSDLQTPPVFVGHLTATDEYPKPVVFPEAQPESDPGTPFALFNVAIGDNNCNAGGDERPSSGVVWP